MDEREACELMLNDKQIACERVVCTRRICGHRIFVATLSVLVQRSLTLISHKFTFFFIRGVVDSTSSVSNMRHMHTHSNLTPVCPSSWLSRATGARDDCAGKCRIQRPGRQKGEWTPFARLYTHILLPSRRSR